MSWIDFDISMNGLEETTNQLSLLISPDFNSGVWDYPIIAINDLLSKRADFITSHLTSESNTKWRRSMAKNSHHVETHLSQRDPVIDNAQVGIRTGTFIDDMNNFPNEYVSGQPLSVLGENSVYKVSIDPSEYALAGNSGYPVIFQNYLIEMGIIPNGGFLHFSDDELSLFMMRLEDSVLKELLSRLG